VSTKEGTQIRIEVKATERLMTEHISESAADRPARPVDQVDGDRKRVSKLKDMMALARCLVFIVKIGLADMLAERCVWEAKDTSSRKIQFLPPSF
jgi:hypothetical protein